MSLTASASVAAAADLDRIRHRRAQAERASKHLTLHPGVSRSHGHRGTGVLYVVLDRLET